MAGGCCSTPPCWASSWRAAKSARWETDAGRFGCDHLVLCAGPQTGKLAAMLGVRVPMVAARAEMIVTEPLPLMKLGGADGNGLYGPPDLARQPRLWWRPA